MSEHDTTAHAIAGSLEDDAAGCVRCDEDMADFGVEVRLIVRGTLRATSAVQASRAVATELNHIRQRSMTDFELDVGEISTRRTT